jgi:hypothetical protein
LSLVPAYFYVFIARRNKERGTGDVGKHFLSNSVAGLSITGYALLISAVIQKATKELSLYHALVVLNLSWLNNITAIHLHWTSLTLRPSSESMSPKELPDEFNLCVLYRFMKSHARELWALHRSRGSLPWLLLSELHLLFTAAFGIYVLATVSSFDTTTPNCTATTVYVIFPSVKHLDPTGYIRIVGLIIYSLAVTPIANILIFVIAFLFLGPVYILAMIPLSFPETSTSYIPFYFLSFFFEATIHGFMPERRVSSRGRKFHREILGFDNGLEPFLLFIILSAWTGISLRIPIVSKFGSPAASVLLYIVFRVWKRYAKSGEPLVICGITLLPPWYSHWSELLMDIIRLIGLFWTIYFICGTEVLISANTVMSGEHRWTFGQTVALVLLVWVAWSTYKDSKENLWDEFDGIKDPLVKAERYELLPGNSPSVQEELVTDEAIPVFYIVASFIFMTLGLVY